MILLRRLACHAVGVNNVVRIALHWTRMRCVELQRPGAWRTLCASLILCGVTGCAGRGQGGRANADVGDDPLDSDPSQADAASDGSVPGDTGKDMSVPGDADAISPMPDEAKTVASPPGSACACDDDCATVESHEAICVYGVCMNRSSPTCSASGSSLECPSGSRCWGIQEPLGAICWPDCDSTSCDGTCDTLGSCTPIFGADCDTTCAEHCSESPPDLAFVPGPAPGPDCPDLPPLECAEGADDCGEIVPFDPDVGIGYEDYPVNGETAEDQYRSYARRDLVMLIQYAAARVACKAADWPFGSGGPIGLGDMSEVDGSIPGTSIGLPSHPAGTHTDGFDADIAYYQVGMPDHRMRPICDHWDEEGDDVFHCTASPDGLDPWRTALFLGAIFEHPSLDVVGCDGQAGPILLAALDQLCADGWIAPDACGNVRLAYEETPADEGWFFFHHTHMHVSIVAPPQ